MFNFRKHRVSLLVLSVGAVAGFLLAARLNVLSFSKAEPENVDQLKKDTQALENSFVNVAEKVGAAVVSISTEHTERVAGTGRYFRFFGDDGFERYFENFFRDFFGEIPEREYKHKGLGSGFIIDNEGYILTNEHVVQDADKITVTLPDGRRFRAKVKGSDMRADLAVIKIKAENLPALDLGDSDKVKIGQWAIAVGNPYGFAVGSAEPTVTVGIISALNRSLPQSYQRRSYSDLIQTDAAINPGNSGGPLVNIKGEVIGINVAIFSPSGGNIGIGFAIPINAAKSILSRLIAGKQILYGWLGVSIQDLDQALSDYFDIADQQGALVINVLKDSPADKAGFKEGDVIRKLAGRQIKDMRSLLREVGKAEVGDVLEVEVVRQKQPLTLRVRIGKRPDEVAGYLEDTDLSWRGIQVSNITSELAARYGITEREAVVVTDVELGSAADEAGVMVGDVIVAINNQRIKDIGDCRSVVQGIKDDALVHTERGFIVLNTKANAD